MAGLPPIRGILTPNIVPLTDSGAIHEAEYRRYVRWLVDKGVHGLYPNGSTGEFTRFTAEERRRIVAIMADEVQGRVPILAGAAEANVKETLSACAYYAQLGCRAVAIVSPIYYRLSEESVYAYFREIAREAPLDVTLYNIPLFASPISVKTVRRLAEEFPRVIGIKDSSGDLPYVLRLMNEVRPFRPDFTIVTGWDAALVPMLMMGCDGGTNATSGVAPELTRAVYDAVTQGRMDDARRLQVKLLKLFDLLFSRCEFPEGFRLGAEIRGFRMGPSRQPQTAEQRSALTMLRREIAAALDGLAVL